MRNGLLLLAGAALLAGCSMQLPSFLGRQGNGSGTYHLGGEPQPEPQTVALREAAAERALFGVIVRVDGEAPSQGYYGAQLRPLAGSTADTLNFELVAIPPASAEAVGPGRTRELSAAVFVPNLMLKKLRTVRVSGGGAVQTLSLPPAPAQ